MRSRLCTVEQVRGSGTAGTRDATDLCLVEEVHVGLIDHTGALHRLAQVLGVRKLSRLLKVIPLQENHQLIRVRGAAKDSPGCAPAGPTGLAGCCVLVVDGPPPRIVFHFMVYKEVRHRRSSPLLASYRSLHSLAGAGAFPAPRRE